MTEEWRDLPVQVDRHYQVSSLGRVRELRPDGLLEVLEQFQSRYGYWHVRLGAGRKPVRTHRLVALAFLEQTGPLVLHKDGDSGNHALDNLYFGTQSEKLRKTVRLGRQAQAARTRCRQGHALDEKNTLIRKDGRRQCRRCNADREAARRKRQREATCGNS